LLLRVEASGICGSDLMEWYRAPQAPVVLGHEVAGVVEEVGPGVERWMPGDRIVATHHVPCNTCRYCTTGRHSACPTLHRTRFDPGGFAELVRLSPLHVEHGVLALPARVSFDTGTFVEPLACALRAQRLAGVSAGDSVAVLGCGVSGILQLRLARATGAGRLFATDANDWRVAAACSHGADLAVRAGPDAVAQIREANGGRGAERVLVCTAAPRALEQALELVDAGGTVLFFAPLAPGEKLELDQNALWRRGVTIVHSYAGPPAEMRVALELIAAGRIDVASMITHRLPLAAIQEAFRLALEAAASLKILVCPQV
jgi:L-iditol 2-dehydrogenase